MTFPAKPGFQPYQERIKLLGVNLSYNKGRNNNLNFFVKIHKMDTKFSRYVANESKKSSNISAILSLWCELSKYPHCGKITTLELVRQIFKLYK